MKNAIQKPINLVLWSGLQFPNLGQLDPKTLLLYTLSTSNQMFINNTSSEVEL